METQKEKTNLEPLLHVLFALGAIILAVSGLVLISLKFFGYPFLFEGVISLFLGLTAIYVAKFHSLMLNVVEAFTDILNKANNIEKTQNSFRGMFPMGGGNVGGMQTINITDEMSEEQIQEVKNKFPHLAPLIDSIKTNFVSESEKDFSKMSIAQLRKELEKAVGSDNYELAAILRDLIENKEG
jgi:hypothetical protein